jgi:hypothetical protein
MIGAQVASSKRSSAYHGWTILSAANMVLVVALACSSTAKVKTSNPCDLHYAYLPMHAPRPPVPIGGFERLAELVRYPKIFLKAGIEGHIKIRLEVLADSTAEIVEVSGPGADAGEKLLGPIFSAIKSLKWIQCPVALAGDSLDQPSVPFLIILDLEWGETPVDTAFVFPEGGVRILANQPRIRPETVPYPGRRVPAPGK